MSFVWGVLSVVLVTVVGCVHASGPWVDTFTPTQTFYIGPNAAQGAGDGSQANPFNIHTAMNRGFGDPGDLYILLDGEYLPKSNGYFLMKCDGTATAPCVLKCPGHCILRGFVGVYATYFWLWGVEVADPGLLYSGVVTDGCPIAVWRNGDLTTRPRGIHFINNYVHDMSNASIYRNAMCSYDDYGSVLYGNILVGQGHNLYTSENYNLGGKIKYVVNNMILDVRGRSASVPKPSGGTHKYMNLHAYSEGASHGMGSVTGMHFAYNIIRNGRSIVGSAYEPDWKNTVSNNVMLSSRLQVGYARPSQAIVTDNTLVDSMLQIEYVWGTDETQYTYPSEATSVTGNTILAPRDVELGNEHISFGARAYTAAGTITTTSIRAGTTVDNNCYSTGFTATATIASGSIGGQGETAWKTLTGFDAHSNFACNPGGGGVVTKWFVNDYDSCRVHGAVINLALSSTVTLDLCSIVNVGSWLSWSLYNASNSIYNGVLAHGARAHCTPTITMNGDQYVALMLWRSTEEDSEDPITSSMGDPLSETHSDAKGDGKTSDDDATASATTLIATFSFVFIALLLH